MYPFGYGLSYTDFVITSVKADADRISQSNVQITATIRNTGSTSGAETVQIYVKAEREGTPNAQLKALKKVQLAPQEEKTVTLSLSPEAFGLFDEAGIRRIYAGEYSVYVGTSQPDSRSCLLTGREPVKLSFKAEEELVLGR